MLGHKDRIIAFSDSNDFTEMTQSYLNNQKTNKPVSEWSSF